MKKLSGLIFLCKAIAKLETCDHKRPYESRFQINIRTAEWKDTLDLRDLLKFDVIEWALRGCHLKDGELTAKTKKQLEMNDIYENALASISTTPNDTIPSFTNLINQHLQATKHDEYFGKPSEPVETIDLVIPFAPEIFQIMVQLTSGWCIELKISLNNDTVVEILRAFGYLHINNEKEVDVFLTDNGAPLHMRIKASNLFCINFVYLLERNKLLAKYRALLNNTDSATEDIEKKLIAAFKNSEKKLLSFVHLLEIEMEDEHVSKLFLRTSSRYFVYEPHYQEQCKVIVLKHEEYIKEPSDRLDLVVELNTLNKTMENRRLDILMPFFDGFCYDAYSSIKSFPSSSYLHEFDCYIQLMDILQELKEVYIYNMVPYYKTLPNVGETEEFLDSLLVRMARAVLRKLDGLSSLFIQGYDRFPEELISELRGKKLRKFGAMGCCGKVDYLVIHRIFSKECPLRKSICHFIGHVRALHFFSHFYKGDVLEEATVYDTLFGAHEVLSESDSAYSERIRPYFNKGNIADAVILAKPISIGTVHYMEPVVLMMQVVQRGNAQNIDYWQLLMDSCIRASALEFVAGCVFSRLNIRFIKTLGFIRHIIILARNEIPTINTLELIINGYMHPHFMYYAFSKGRRRCNNELCFVVNFDAKTILHESCALNGHPMLSFYHLFGALIRADDSKLSLKIRLRRTMSDNFNTVRSQFIEFYETKHPNDNHDILDRVIFEEIPYEFNNESSIVTILQ
ncbi:hypothetical protein ENBRE01_2875 [Enteropsectra breve]|nr:hypothetical protein ENBRE01_2875 [Enteropsectra breve]